MRKYSQKVSYTDTITQLRCKDTTKYLKMKENSALFLDI